MATRSLILKITIVPQKLIESTQSGSLYNMPILFFHFITHVIVIGIFKNPIIKESPDSPASAPLLVVASLKNILQKQFVNGENICAKYGQLIKFVRKPSRAAHAQYIFLVRIFRQTSNNPAKSATLLRFLLPLPPFVGSFLFHRSRLHFSSHLSPSRLVAGESLFCSLNFRIYPLASSI